MSSKRGIATGAAATEAESTGRHFLVILGLGAAVWILLLRFFFPGYLDPFVPFHVDHFRYLGASAEGYGAMRYIRLYPRPIGNLIFDLLGRLGTRGMLVPVFALTLLNAALLIRYVERLTGRLISAFTVAFFSLWSSPTRKIIRVLRRTYLPSSASFVSWLFSISGKTTSSRATAGTLLASSRWLSSPAMSKRHISRRWWSSFSSKH